MVTKGMVIACCYILQTLLLLVATSPCSAQDKPVAWWSFDHKAERSVTDKATDVVDQIEGNFWYAAGVSGNCLKADGYTTHLVRRAEKAPVLDGALTIEAWVAPQTYPWNWTGIVDQEKDHKAGLFFGVSADGKVGLGVASADGKWVMAVSNEKLELLKWSHIAATYRPTGELQVWINGKKTGSFSAHDQGMEWKGRKDAGHVDLYIGMSHTKMYAAGTEREPSRQLLSNMVFDGLIDEVKIYEGAMDEEQVQRAYLAVQPAIQKPLEYRRFPTEGAGKREFKAFQTTLKYDETWDALWRIGGPSDIVVTFDKPVRIVFWHGTAYGACYVTENEKWMGDQSVESNLTDHRAGGWGCAEHMSDKQCRYSQVRLIENNPARVIVHWRYCPCFITYGMANMNPLTRWGDWVDEYFVIYPDVVAVRKQMLWSSNFKAALDTTRSWLPDASWHQFQETILFHQPGTRPEDNVEMGALSVATMEGQSYTCMWGKEAKPKTELEGMEVVRKANIQMTNLKSQYKPFIIFETGSVIDPWPGPGFPFWNHWPVAQLPSDGRVAPEKDQPAHTSLSCGAPVVHKGEGGSHIAVMLYGLSDAVITNLVPLARSWNFPADLKVVSGSVKSRDYDKFQRAYVLECGSGASESKLVLTGSKDTPIVNPAFVFKSWGEKKFTVTLDGRRLSEGSDYRVGYEDHLEGKDAVLWLQEKSENSQSIEITPVE